MQMLLKGHLHKPKDGIPHGAAWCNNIERCAAQNYIAREQHDRKSLRPSESSRVTELWSFLMTCMLRVDAHKRFSAKKCLEVGNSTVFKFVQKTKGEGQRIPTGRQHGGSSLGPTASESKGRISTADVETSDSEETANEQDQPIHPIVAVRDVMNPKTYNSAASGVAYDQGVNEAEVWKDQGSKADGTVKPTIEGATDEPASLTSEDLEYLERMLPIKKANGEGNRDSSGVSPHSTATNNPYQPAVLPNASTSAANNAQQPAVLPNTPISTANIAPGQTLDFASMEMAKNNYEEILMAWLRS